MPDVHIAAPPLWMYLIGFLLLLGPLVTLHELGHYLVGRWFGVKADTFSIGFGKEVAGITDRRGTRWRLSALPLGGYVQFAGDMNPASQPTAEWLALPAAERARTFQAKPVWQRALIVAAGPVTNVLVAVAILTAFNMAYGKIVVPPRIASVVQGSVADRAGLKPGDMVRSYNEIAVEDFTDMAREIAMSPGERLTLVVEREGETRTADLQLQALTVHDEFGNAMRIGRLGIGSGKGERLAVGPVEAATLAARQTGGIITTMVRAISQLFTGERPLSELGGPIKMAKFSGEQLTLGWQAFVYLAAMVSINLAFINALPIPALDGGHLAFYAAEAIRRKPLGRRSQEWAFRTGMAFVLALMLFVTINDIVSLPVFGG